MPEFRLPLETTAAHLWFDGLCDFARGYVEAAFFCGIEVQDADGDMTEAAGLGPANLDDTGRSAMEADAVRFWFENEADIAEAISRTTYSLDDAGRDFWYTRNHHGTGYWDRALGEAGERLSRAAQVSGSCDLFAECSDPDDVSGWTVTLDAAAEPLSATERDRLAALVAAKTGGNLDPLTDVASPFGAPLGRPERTIEENEPLVIQHVALDPGGYDAGGAYWGLGAPLWRIAGTLSGGLVFLRAASREAALAEIRR